MSTKLKETKVREKFRPAVKVNCISQVERDDEHFQYKEVIFDYSGPNNGLARVERYLDAGWETVTSTDTVLDDRSNIASENKEEKLRPKQVTGTTSDGKHWVLLRILKTTKQKNEQTKAKLDLDRFQKSTQRKITKKGSTVTIDDGTIQYNK